MKILQIGAGSMGTRRLRDLARHPDVTLALFDERPDRRAAAEKRFGIPTFPSFAAGLDWRPDALIISTPPGTKADYLATAYDRGLHHFSEADIWTYGAAERSVRHPGLVGVPSESIAFLPLIRQLGPLIRENLGTLLGYQFFMSTYMPAWHPTEGLEYYARHRNAAPAREMIPFELGYLNTFFSPAVEVAGRYEKFGDLPGAIEDTWSLSMRLRDGGVGQLTITQACPAADYRQGCAFGTRGSVRWDVGTGEAVIQTTADKSPRTYAFGRIGDVLEASYAEEIATFVAVVQGKKTWANPYAIAQESCATLAAAERSAQSGRWETVRPQAEPAHLEARPANGPSLANRNPPHRSA